MAASTVSEKYDASADAAWALLGDFPGIAGVFPEVTDVSCADDVRTFSLMGMRLSEKLLSRDDDARTLTYSIIDGVPGVEHHEATIQVTPAGEGCEVTWAVTSVPEAAQPIFADSYQRALQTLHGSLDAT